MMENLEQIREVISTHGKLIASIKDKIEIMKRHDSAYDPGRGVESIHFEHGNINVTYDDSCYGYSASSWFSFPLSYLVLTDEELKERVLKDKEDREKLKMQEEEMREIKDTQEKEQREREQYAKLKEKFGN